MFKYTVNIVLILFYQCGRTLNTDDSQYLPFCWYELPLCGRYLDIQLIIVGHGAANVTLGIPRLREIVMTASQKPKTPSMSMLIRESVSQAEIDLFCKRASRVALSQLVEDVVVREISKVEGGARRTVFSIDINFFPEEEYTSEYDLGPFDLLNAFSIRFPMILKKEIANEMKKLDADLKSQIAELGKGKKSSTREGGDGDAEDEEEEGPRKKRGGDDESEAGDGDADDEKRARQKKQQATYESDEDQSEDEGEEGEGEFDDAEIEAAYAEDDDVDIDSDKKKRKKKKASSLDDEVSRVSEMFMKHLQHATSFTFNSSRCTLELEVCNLAWTKITRSPVFHSSPLTCQSCYLLALLNERVEQLSSVR